MGIKQPTDLENSAAKTQGDKNLDKKALTATKGLRKSSGNKSFCKSTSRKKSVVTLFDLGKPREMRYAFYGGGGGGGA